MHLEKERKEELFLQVQNNQGVVDKD